MTAAAASETWFQIDLNKSFDFTGMTAATVTLNLCAVSASTAGVTVQLALQSASDFYGNYGPTKTVATVSACPTMESTSLPVIVSGQTLTVSAVRYVDVIVKSLDPISATVTPTVINVDSISVSNNVFGPFDFAYNTQPLLVNTGVPPVAGSTVTFAGSGGAGTGGAPGVVALAVPFTAASTGTFFNLGLAGTVNLSGQTITYNMCVTSTTPTPANYTYQATVTDNAGGGFYGGPVTLSTLSTCPTMTAVPVSLASATVSAINNVGLKLSSTAAATTAATASVEIDSIRVTGNSPVGPYDFAFNSGTFAVNPYMAVTSSTVTWQAAP